MASHNKFKLNANDRDAIGQAGQNVLALIAALEIRLAEAEHQPPVHIPATQGQAVLFYPNTEEIKTSDGTKAKLQKAIQPGRMGIPVHSVRRIGNSGIAVTAATPAAAEKLKAAVPPTLKVTEPRGRRPLVAIRNLRVDSTADSLLEDLQTTNLSDDPEWTLEKKRANCRVAFKTGRRGERTTVVFECSPSLRDKLIGLGRVYIGWDEADVCDYLRVTSCNRCHQYGHPEKFRRAPEMVCGRCGETGHKKTECQSQSECCATCKRFKRKEAGTHVTNAPTCPARIYAQQQSVNMTQYGYDSYRIVNRAA
ncbi:unnamed protein product [Euphydryas editha]|uniref:CCHC-type domain-containing protein n=2 Tax=Euphydryas editha TaxID=104508 RepID=A0AAU9TCV7_EUPED|nr:unnamed protein product [Euphydryas editha]